jgi:hypothetical protein
MVYDVRRNCNVECERATVFVTITVTEGCQEEPLPCDFLHGDSDKCLRGDGDWDPFHMIPIHLSEYVTHIWCYHLPGFLRLTYLGSGCNNPPLRGIGLEVY